MERAYKNRLKFSLRQGLDAALFEKTLNSNVLADPHLAVDFPVIVC